MDNHILEGSYPDTVPTFTPRDANPNHKNAIAPAEVGLGDRPTLEKAKAEFSPLGTLAKECTSKRQKLKPSTGERDFTKAGLFHCKEGTAITDLFPTDLSKKYCSFFCFHAKKCSKPKQSCDFEHIGKWDKIPAGDQAKIFEHFHASDGKVWLDSDTFAKHRVTNIPDKFAHLIDDAKGPKSA